MLSPELSKSLNKQIELEGFSSQYYLAMASWAETQGLNGVSAFLYHHSDEERMHMPDHMAFQHLMITTML